MGRFKRTSFATASAPHYLVLGRSLHMIDGQNLNVSLGGKQLEAKFILHVFCSRENSLIRWGAAPPRITITQTQITR
jgi:hypothetical protein